MRTKNFSDLHPGYANPLRNFFEEGLRQVRTWIASDRAASRHIKSRRLEAMGNNLMEMFHEATDNLVFSTLLTCFIVYSSRVSVLQLLSCAEGAREAACLCWEPDLHAVGLVLGFSGKVPHYILQRISGTKESCDLGHAEIIFERTQYSESPLD